MKHYNICFATQEFNFLTISIEPRTLSEHTLSLNTLRDVIHTFLSELLQLWVPSSPILTHDGIQTSPHIPFDIYQAAKEATRRSTALPLVPFHVAPCVDAFTASFQHAESITVPHKQLTTFRKAMTGRLFGNRSDLILPDAVAGQLASPAQATMHETHKLHAYFARMRQRHA